MKTLMYILLALVAILVILVFTGKKSVESRLIIHASPERVWSVLTHTSEYPNWNPVMQLLEGEIAEGNKVKYQFTQDENNVSEIESTVQEVIPRELLNQKGGIPMVLTFDHKYILKQVDAETELTIHEDYAGIGVNFWNPAPVEKAYERLNEAIKSECEKE